MRERQERLSDRRAREFESFVAGAAGRLLHTATLLTAETAADNPRARRLLLAALAGTYASWDRLRGEDPYDHARARLALRFARTTWYPAFARRTRPPGVLAALPPQERLVLTLRVYEGVAEEQCAALLGLPPERVRALCARGVADLLHPAPKAAPTARTVTP